MSFGSLNDMPGLLRPSTEANFEPQTPQIVRAAFGVEARKTLAPATHARPATISANEGEMS
jgi:hypothetical protein